ncbi:MAG TPA: sarcosine oxidase subunit beta [Chloroflexi bacterium]|nr:sarcosine oxidase subunit beta [Chloroflexota bacterium]
MPQSWVQTSPNSSAQVNEVLVVGGGIVGLSVAWSMRRRGVAVRILERGVCGQGSTAKATGGIRSQFGSEVNVRLTLASLSTFRDWTLIHGGDVGFRQVGYLFLATSAAHIEAHRLGAELQRRCGARVELLDADETSARLPWVVLDDVMGASFGPDDGIADPGAAVASMVSSCRRSGVEISEGVVVQAIEQSGGQVTGVTTTARSIAADVVVICAGPWSALLAATAGISLPVTPHHRQVYRTGAVRAIPSVTPFVIDQGTGVYFHSDGGGLIFGGGDRDGAEGFDESFRAEESPRIIELLSRRLPQVLDAELTGGWAGVRDMTPDDLAVVGALPSPEGAYIATGFSGHGFMHAPAIGEEVARLVAGEAPGLDMATLLPTRFDSALRREPYVF